MNKKFLKDVTANIFTLAVNVVTPLLLIPILTRSLGLDIYGDYMASLGFIFLCVVLADLGFSMYLSKEVSIQRENAQEVSKLYSAFLTVKLFFLLPFLLLLFLLLPEIPNTNRYIVLGLFWLLFVNISIKPTAFYNGLEKYTLQSKVEICGKFLLILLILFFDLSDEGIEKVMVAQVLSAVFINIFMFHFLLKETEIKFRHLPKDSLVDLVRLSFGFFIARLFVNIYTQSSTYLVSLVLKSELVAIYSILIQLYKVGQAVVGAISKVLYTNTVKSKNFKRIVKVSLIIILLHLLFLPLVAAYGVNIVNTILNINIDISNFVLMIPYLSLLFVIIASFWGYPVMIALGKERYAHYGIFFGSLAYYFTFIIFVLFFDFNLYLALFCIFISDFTSAILRLYFANKFLTKEMLFI